jgi:hypothetical protein
LAIPATSTKQPSPAAFVAVPGGMMQVECQLHIHSCLYDATRKSHVPSNSKPCGSAATQHMMQMQQKMPAMQMQQQRVATTANTSSNRHHKRLLIRIKKGRPPALGINGRDQEEQLRQLEREQVENPPRGAVGIARSTVMLTKSKPPRTMCYLCC